MSNSYFDNFKELKERWYKGVKRDIEEIVMMVDEMNNTEMLPSSTEMLPTNTEILESDILEKDTPEKDTPENNTPENNTPEKAISENNISEKSNRFDFMSNKGIYRPPSLRKRSEQNVNKLSEQNNKSSDHTNKSNKYLPSNLSYLLRELSRIMNNQPKASDRISRKIMLEYIWDYLKVNNPSVLLEIESIIPDEMQMLIPKIYMKHLSFVQQES